MLSWFSDMRMSKKLTLALSVLVISFVSVSAVVMVNLQTSQTESRLSERSNAVLFLVESASGAMNQQSSSSLAFLVQPTPKRMASYQAASRLLDSAIDKLGALNLPPEQAQEVSALKSGVETWRSVSVEPRIRLAGDPATHDQAIAVFNTGAGVADITKIRNVIAQIEQTERANLTRQTQARDGAAALTTAFILGGAAFAVVVSLLMNWLLTHDLAAPVVAMATAMKKIAGGDNTVAIPAIGRKDEVGQMAAAVETFKQAAIERLQLEERAVSAQQAVERERAANETERGQFAQQQATVVQSVATGLERLSAGELTFRLDERFAAEYESLRADFNSAMQKLQETMKVVSNNAASIRSGAGEISSASDDLSRRTEQQAASLEETAAALDEITATVRKTADGARHAQSVVTAAKDDAERSELTVRDTVAAMSEIETSSQQISQIVSIIDEIAFQTNLLALNAGVEAARAGDAGRGFAVVAQEVRALAQRSAGAAKEIKTLISASTRQVTQGVNLVGETGKALERIVGQVSELNSVVTEIAASAQEQATGLQQVNVAVNQMDQTTQQNAAMVEQSTAASHSLAAESEQLAQLIGTFQIEKGVSSARAPAPRRPSGPATVTAMKVVGSAVARKPEPAQWEEF